MRFEGRQFELAAVGVLINLCYYEWYQKNSQTLFISFADIMTRPAQVVADIAAYLNIPLSEHMCNQIATDHNLENSQKVIANLSQLPKEQVFHAGPRVIDKSTLLQTGHIAGAKTSIWQTTLDRDQQLIANRIFKRWLLLLGYENETSLTNLALPPLDDLEWYAQIMTQLDQSQQNYPPEWLREVAPGLAQQLFTATSNYINNAIT
jgi:hypothetical protein